MANLMHPRVAENYHQLGFYPTDEATVKGIKNLIASSNEAIKFLDPCCGCATALSLLANKAQFPFSKRFGIELDEERAAISKPKLHAQLHASALDTHVTPQAVDCLFLNPPYGWDLKDQEDGAKAERLEHLFLYHFFASLRAGGLLIYIIPKSSFDMNRQKWLISRFEQLSVFEAATNRFDQIVVIGIKRSNISAIDAGKLAQYEVWKSGIESWLKLPASPVDQYYLSSNDKTLNMFSKKVDPEGLIEVRKQYKGLWQDFEQHFCQQNDTTSIRPIHDLTDWHTCLLITSGVVGGLIDNGKRALLIKGKTLKTKAIKSIENENGEVTHEEHRDRFQTIIKAIDMTEDSPHFGNIIMIN